MPRATGWSDDELLDAVRDSASLREVTRRLGLTAGGGTYSTLRRHIRRLGIDASHLPVLVGGRAVPRKSWSDDDLIAAVEGSTSYAQVLRRLGYQPSGGIHRMIVRHIGRLGLSTDHFTGQAWAQGTHNRNGFRPRPLDEILVAKSSYSNSGRLRLRLIAAGLKAPRCELCGVDSWRGAVLPLQLDHINGDPSDNRLCNLRILCPNCHAQTDTWCARNRSRRTPIG